MNACWAAALRLTKHNSSDKRYRHYLRIITLSRFEPQLQQVPRFLIAVMAAPEDNRPGAEAVGKALVEFALNGTFPEEDLAARQIEIHELDPAIAVLEEARMKLEAEIKAINDETFHDVNTWFQNAASLEDDIKRSRRMADDIEAEAHAPQASGQAIWEAEQKAEFLAHEMNFSERLYHTLESIKAVKELLDKSEEASRKRSILESLLFLEGEFLFMSYIYILQNYTA